MSFDDERHALPARPRVVLVEDDAVLRDDILVPGLQEAGFKVTAAGSAAQLYECLRGGPFDIVVLDVGLPDGDGFEVARHVRSMSSVGIVLLTGRGSDVDRVQGLGAGADIYLAKPIEVDVLAATLRSLARRVQPAPTRTWRIGTDGWHLYAPDGTSIELSGPERVALRLLFASAGTPVRRDELITALSDNATDFDPHRLEMMVHRLRGKTAAAVDTVFPLRTVRGKGYVLALGED
ncbi:MAG: response regulator transcription factor [Dokdonella sp.]